jgi:hypothetical protein
MSDSIKYMSAASGEVELRPHFCGADLRTPGDVERVLAMFESRGERRASLWIALDAWPALRGCFADMAKFAEPVPVRTDRNGLVDPSIFTDDQLRAECERRGVDVHWYCGCGFSHEHEAVTVAHEQTCPESEVSLRRERDEWKRRAEAAEARDGYTITPVELPSMTATEKRAFIEKADAIINAAMRGMKPSPEAVRAVLMNESGPGIAATPKRDDTLDQATLADLLAEDAP